MKLIESKAEYIPQEEGLEGIYKQIELAGRTAYHSQDKITPDSAKDFVDRMVKSKHGAALEHGTIYLYIPSDYEGLHSFYLLNPFSKTAYLSIGIGSDGLYVSTNMRVLQENDHLDDLKYLCSPTKFHEKRYTMRFTCSRAIAQELTRHRVFSYCLSGDTVIYSFRGNKKWTIKQLFEWQNDFKYSGKLKLINVRSVDESSQIIIPNKINKVFKTGVKDVYEVTTQSGRTIKTTMEHQYYTPEGYRKLSELKVGDYIYANGKELLDNEEWLRNTYIKQNKTRKEVANIIGCCETFVYRAFKKFNIVKSVSDYPNRKPGYGKKGMFSKEALIKIGETHKGHNNPMWKEQKTENGARNYARKNYKKDYCELCGNTDSLEQHHWDKNPKNYSEDNLITVCTQCHKLIHGPGTLGVFSDKIVSIQYVGTEDVYDIEMQGVHNFVANGLIVHNCQESQRYINYSKERHGEKITYIKPSWLEESEEEANSFLGLVMAGAELNEHGEKVYPFFESLVFAEKNYFVLLNKGFTPQQARDVLPNATKTELIMTGFSSDWRHVMDLRLFEKTGAVHPDMKDLMQKAQKAMQEAGIWKDIISKPSKFE